MLRLIVLVLKPGEDLRTTIEAAVEREHITAGTVISCVGALSQARLRMANSGRQSQDVHDYQGGFEIVSLIGNIGPGRTHLHMSIADQHGKVIGGHIKTGGNIVDITAELVILADDSQRFIQRHDHAVGWDNLVIEQIDAR